MNPTHARVFAALAVLTGISVVSATAEESVRPPLVGLSLTVGVKHSDNRDAIPSGFVVNDEPLEKEDQTEMWIRPTITLKRTLAGKYDFSLAYSPSYTYFDNPRDGGTENEFSHAVRGNFSFQIGPRTQFILSDNYWWSGNKDWYYGEDYEFSPNEMETRNDDYYKNNLSVSLKRDLTADDWFRLTGRWDIKRYEDQFVADYGDEDEYVLLAELMRRSSRHLSYGIYSEYTAFDRNNGESADPIDGSETEGRIDTGVQYINTGLQMTYDFFGNQNVVLSGRTGYNFLWYEADGIDDDDMIGDSAIELLLFQQERTNGRIGLKVGKEYGNVYPYSSQDNTTLFASLNRVLGRRNKLRVGLDAEYRTRTYELAKVDPDAAEYGYYQEWVERQGYSDDATRDSTYLRVHASYKWTADLSTSVFYSYEDVDSDVDTSYTENTIGISATYRFL